MRREEQLDGHEKTISDQRREIGHLRALIKAQEELLVRYRIGSRQGIDGILERMAAAKEALGLK